MSILCQDAYDFCFWMLDLMVWVHATVQGRLFQSFTYLFWHEFLVVYEYKGLRGSYVINKICSILYGESITYNKYWLVSYFNISQRVDRETNVFDTASTDGPPSWNLSGSWSALVPSCLLPTPEHHTTPGPTLTIRQHIMLISIVLDSAPLIYITKSWNIIYLNTHSSVIIFFKKRWL